MVNLNAWPMIIIFGICAAFCSSIAVNAGNVTATARLDPVTRYMYVSYQVPANAPDAVDVRCTWSADREKTWNPARVTPLISETGMVLATDADKDRWQHGFVTERRAAGLIRTVVFDPYPEAQKNGVLDVDFRMEIYASGKELSSQTVHLGADNTDVIYITDWSKILQPNLVAASPAAGKWLLRDKPNDHCLSCPEGTPVSAITYPLDLKGTYAIFVSTDPSKGPISLRLSGDEWTDKVNSSAGQKETLWRWASMDRQHLIVKQTYSHNGYAASSLDYVKLVPLTKKIVNSLNGKYAGKHDKFLAAYFEPYTWAFFNDIRENYQHRKPLSAYQEAGVDLVDAQLARFGDKSVFETRVGDQLLYNTRGDMIEGVVPVTDNVGRMQQYTNTLQSEIRYAKELGIGVHANFGATACYHGTPLESDFSKEHPNWRRGDSLLLSVPEVRQYMLNRYREVLEIGAPGISVDFCRYPDGVDSARDCNRFMRDLHKLADEFSQIRGNHVTVLARFPSIGTKGWECFDYKTWAREGLVDYLCPSNIVGLYQFFDLKPYLNAVKNTKCKLLPEIDALEWGPTWPGELLWRTKELYDSGADGVYIYQADRIIEDTAARRYLSLLRSREAVNRWLKADEDNIPNCSKGIYIVKPADPRGYASYERPRIWVEGVKVSEMEMYLDGKLINKLSAPPYILGTEGYDSDNLITTGEHVLTVGVKDGTGWLEQEFKIRGL